MSNPRSFSTTAIDSLSLKGQVIYKCYANENGHLFSPILVKSLHPIYDAEVLRRILLMAGQGYGYVKPEWIEVSVTF